MKEKISNPWRHHDLVTELEEPKLKFNAMLKQLPSSTLHLLKSKHFSFCLSPTSLFLEPRNLISRAYSNSETILKKPSVILINFPEYPKTVNQQTPELHTHCPIRPIPWVQFSLQPTIFLHNCSLMSAVTRAEY